MLIASAYHTATQLYLSFLQRCRAGPTNLSSALIIFHPPEWLDALPSFIIARPELMVRHDAAEEAINVGAACFITPLFKYCNIDNYRLWLK